jgi:hypothetical protein
VEVRRRGGVEGRKGGSRSRGRGEEEGGGKQEGLGPGYNIHPPFVGHVNGMHPLKQLSIIHVWSRREGSRSKGEGGREV